MRAVLFLCLAALGVSSAGGPAPDLVARARTPALGEPVLDLALLDDETILALSPEAVALYRWASDGLTLDSRRLLPGPRLVVRAPGGILTPPDDGGAFWALTSRVGPATLYRIEGRQLVEVSQADALPWPGCIEGLRFRPGTNLLEARIASLGMGPFLTLEPGFAVDQDARLRASAEGALQGSLRVGPTLAVLGDSLLAASTPEAPGSADAVLLFLRETDAWTIARSFPVEGAVRALAARMSRDRFRLVAAIEEPDGSTHLLILDLARQAT